MSQTQIEIATEAIWRELNKRLRQFVRSRVRSEADVDDILQTVFLRIHSRLPELRVTSRLESWIFQVTRNAITDVYRKTTVLQGQIGSIDNVAVEEVDNELAVDLAKCLRGCHLGH